MHEGNETFIATLKTSESTPGHISLGAPSTAAGVIIDDDELCKHINMLFTLASYVHVNVSSCYCTGFCICYT